MSHPSVAWTTICLPKVEGGLGIWDLVVLNYLLLAKILWNIHAKKDTLWYHWIQHYYMCHTDLWSWTLQNRDLPLIKGLFHIRDVMLSRCSSQDRVTQRYSYGTTVLIPMATQQRIISFKPWTVPNLGLMWFGHWDSRLSTRFCYGSLCMVVWGRRMVSTISDLTLPTIFVQLILRLPLNSSFLAGLVQMFRLLSGAG